VLTGGDPLVLSARRIAETTKALAAIPHVKILRWHTRMPVAAPERVTSAMARALTSGHDKTVYVALHANHSRELTPQARAACKRLIAAGAAMVSQTVLLKGVNDNIEALEDLMRALVEARVKPYYLHHRAFSHDDRGGAGAGAPVAPARIRPGATVLCPRYSWRLRQGADFGVVDTPDRRAGLGSDRPAWRAACVHGLLRRSRLEGGRFGRRQSRKGFQRSQRFKRCFWAHSPAWRRDCWDGEISRSR
jgi:hypothetical protein